MQPFPSAKEKRKPLRTETTYMIIITRNRLAEKLAQFSLFHWLEISEKNDIAEKCIQIFIAFCFLSIAVGTSFVGLCLEYLEVAIHTGTQC